MNSRYSLNCCNFLIVRMFIIGLCLCTPCADRENEFCMILRIVLYISMLVVHGLGRSMRSGTSLVETTCIYIVRVGYIICPYLSCSQGSEETSAFIRVVGEPCVLCHL